METFGDACHFNQNDKPVPVCIVTTLDGKIILTNDVYEFDTSRPEGQQQNKSPKNGEWVISGCRVMLTRFWSTSSASVIATCTVSDPNTTPKEFTELIDIEDEFCIYLGYIESCRTVDIQDIIENNLIRVFVGIVDNVKATASGGGGYTIQIQARDRVKWFMDSDIYYNQQKLTNAAVIPRSTLLLDLARKAIGQVEEYDFVYKENGTEVTEKEPICEGCGKKIIFNARYVYDLLSRSTLKDIGDSKETVSDLWYQSGGVLTGKTTNDNIIVNSDPEFRIHTTRPALSMQGSTNETSVNETINFIINAQLPIEIIKTLAFQEIYPTEFFQDHRDGNLYYAPRANDATGLTDPKRFYRTYFYGTAPIDSNINQRLLVLREERSSSGMRTNFIVSASNPATTNTPHEDKMLHLKVIPYAFKDKKYACKYHRVHDPTIKNMAEAALVAVSMARIFAKETRAAMAVLIGDPSFVPGEVIQVLGSPLLDQGGRDRHKSDRDKFFNYNAAWASYLKDYSTAAEKEETSTEFVRVESNAVKVQIPDTNRVSTTSADIRFAPEINSDVKFSLGSVIDMIQCNAVSTINNAVPSEENSDETVNTKGFDEPPRTIFRVEAVSHKFQSGSAGFKTEVALVDPF